MRRIKVDITGLVTFIWHDDLACLLGEGKGTVMRASHVEPNAEGKWTADLSPVGGPKFGPYVLRQTALDAEVQWLDDNMSELRLTTSTTKGGA